MPGMSALAYAVASSIKLSALERRFRSRKRFLDTRRSR